MLIWKRDFTKFWVEAKESSQCCNYILPILDCCKLRYFAVLMLFYYIAWMLTFLMATMTAAISAPV